MTALTVRGACAALGVPLGSSHSNVRNAYRQILLTAHPDKGGDRDAFMLARRAWEVLQKYPDDRRLLARSRCPPQARKRSSTNSNGGPAAKKPRQHQPTNAGHVCVSAHLSTLLVDKTAQTRKPLDWRRLTRADDLLDSWKRDALAATKEGFGTSMSSTSVPNFPGVDPICATSTSSTADQGQSRQQPAEVKQGICERIGFCDDGTLQDLLNQSQIDVGLGEVLAAARSRQNVDRNKATKKSAKPYPGYRGTRLAADLSMPPPKRHTTVSRRSSRQHEEHRKSSKGSLAAALARHVQSEAARARTAEKTRNTLDRCPMLARHLHAEAAAREAAAKAVPHCDIEAVVALIRAAPREERRSRIEALPKATRAALEQHLVAEKAANDASSICSTTASTASTTIDGASELDPSHCSGSTGKSISKI
jgi:hypothetical protein